MQTLLKSTTHSLLAYSFGVVNNNTSVSTNIVIDGRINEHTDDSITARIDMVRDERWFTQIEKTKYK